MRKYLIIAVLITMLIAFADCKAKEKGTSANTTDVAETEDLLIHEANFNGEDIKIIVNYSENEDDYATYLEGLVFDYQGKKHTIELAELITDPYSSGDILWHITVTDMNFDGFMDFQIEEPQQGDNFYYEFFLYNPETKSYFHHKKLSDMTGVQVDPDEKTISTTSFSSGEGTVWDSEEYRWEGTELELFRTVEQTHIDGYKFKRVTKTLQGDGSWKTTTETVQQ